MKKLFIYFINFFSGLKNLAQAVNEASSVEEMDKLICGGKNDT